MLLKPLIYRYLLMVGIFINAQQSGKSFLRAISGVLNQFRNIFTIQKQTLVFFVNEFMQLAPLTLHALRQKILSWPSKFPLKNTVAIGNFLLVEILNKRSVNVFRHICDTGGKSCFERERFFKPILPIVFTLVHVFHQFKTHLP